mgnify:CR=1 FL=1
MIYLKSMIATYTSMIRQNISKAAILSTGSSSINTSQILEKNFFIRKFLILFLSKLLTIRAKSFPLFI